MKHTISFILAILLASTLLLNCDCKHLCTSPSPRANFVNFDSTALNAVVVKQYNNNGQFNDLQHTTVYSSMVFNNTHMPGPDTSHLDAAGINLEYFTDYVIEVPAAGKKWYIKSLSVQPAKMSEQYC